MSQGVARRYGNEPERVARHPQGQAEIRPNVFIYSQLDKIVEAANFSEPADMPAGCGTWNAAVFMCLFLFGAIRGLLGKWQQKVRVA